MEHLLDTFLVTYLTALATSPKLCLPAMTECIKGDISAVFVYFGEFKPDKELEKYFEVVKHILAMLKASKSMAFLSFWAFAKVQRPCILFVEGLMKARGDFNWTAVSEVMEAIRCKVRDEGLTDRTYPIQPPFPMPMQPCFSLAPEPMIMKKIVVQSSISCFLQTVSYTIDCTHTGTHFVLV